MDNPASPPAYNDIVTPEEESEETAGEDDSNYNEGTLEEDCVQGQRRRRKSVRPGRRRR